MSDTPWPRLHPPAPLRPIVTRLEAAGFPTWCVGGAVRDAILGVPAGDWDLASRATPAQVKALFPRHCVPTGEAHGTVTIGDGQGFWSEITTFRRDVSTDGRNATVAFATTIDEDLARRDFTCNALAYRLATEEGKDLVGGRADMARGVLRTVGDAATRFEEDRLRILRAFRLAGKFDWQIAPDTWAAAAAGASALDRLSAERVKQEVDKTFASSHPSRALRWWDEAEAWAEWAPEWHAVPRATRAAWWPRLDQAAADWRESGGADDARAGGRERLALALAITGAAGAETALRRWRASIEERETIVAWLTHVERDAALLDVLASTPTAGWPRADVRAAVSRWGRGTVPAILRLHGQRARRPAGETHQRTQAVTALIAGAPLQIRDLAIRGDDLARAGYRPGPAMGAALTHLLAWVLQDPSQNTARDLLDEAERVRGRLEAPTRR